jgi:glycosyltransferase involved in cell wall biosynthesis
LSKLSCIIITRNESKNIRRCLESVSWTDEIVVVDSFSQDDTKKIASEFTGRIFDLKWGGFGPAKDYAVKQATGDWILSVDADELVPENLREEIQKIVQSGDSLDGYFIPRRSYFLGRWMRHGGWYPDFVLRLFKKDKGDFTSRLVHEEVIVQGRTGRLKNDLLHYTDPDYERYLEKLNRYTTIDAQQRYLEGNTGSSVNLLIRPVAVFFKTYFLKRGFLDGLPGLILAVSSAFHVFAKYVKLWHLGRPKKDLVDNAKT